MAKKPTYKELEQRVKELEKEAPKHKRAAQLELIYEVGQSVSGELELEALFSKIVDTVHDAFGYYGVMLLLVDEETERLTMQSIVGGYANLFPKDLWLTIREGMIGYATASGKTQLSGDVSKHPHYVRKAKEKTKSELAVPIKSEQKVIGVLDIQSDEFDAFDKTDMMVMETLADQIAVAIKNAQLFETVQQELTERKQAEEALRESEQLLSNVFESMQEGVLVLNTDFKYTHWNRSMEEISHTQREEVLGRIPWEKFPFLKGGIDEAMKKAMSGDVSRNIELKYILSDGKEGWTTEHYFPLKDSDAKIVGAVGVIDDITERKRAEEALRESEEGFRRLFEQSNDAVFIHQSGQIIDANQRACEILGYNQEQLLTMSITDLHPEKKRLESRKRIDTTIRGKTMLFETQWRRSDGTIVDVEVSSRVIDDEKRIIQGVACDITERKRAEQEREKLQAKLQRAEKMEAIGTLAGGVAHDLNNVLSGIVSYPELLLLDLPEDSPLRKPILTIQTSGQKAADIVQDLLTLARRGVVATEVVNLNELSALQADF